jgi:hypothetical protein
MKLVPAVIGIENPRTGQRNVIPNRGDGQVATIARHQLDNQAPARVGRVHSIGQGAIGVEVDMHIAVALVAKRDNSP